MKSSTRGTVRLQLLARGFTHVARSKAISGRTVLFSVSSKVCKQEFACTMSHPQHAMPVTFRLATPSEMITKVGCVHKQGGGIACVPQL